MKKLIISFFFVTACNLFVYTQVTLYSVYFTDVNTGYAVGWPGTILKTTNGGEEWNLQVSGVEKYLYSVYFIDSNNGYAVGDNTILKTSDGGVHWIKNSYNSGYLNWNLFSVFFPNADTGYISGQTGTILKTTDAGVNWSSLTAPGFNTNFNFVYFMDSNTGYMAGDEFIFKTINGGTDWTEQSTGIDESYTLESIYFDDAITGYAVGNVGTIIKTTNGGSNWTIETSGTTVWLSSVYFTDANTGYAVGGSGTILKTINGGNDWVKQTSGTVASLLSIFFTSSETGYAVGSNSTILKTINGGNNWTKQNIVTSLISSNTSEESNLDIYPNPSNGNFTIEFDNPDKKIIQISIIDLSGKKLFETSCSQGKYEFKEKALSPGLYIIEINGDNVDFRKMIVR